MSDVFFGPDSKESADVSVARVPAVFVNHFHVAAGNGFVKITGAESPDGKNFAYRGAFLINVEGAMALAEVIQKTVVQLKEALAAAPGTEKT